MLWKRSCVLGLQVCGRGLEGCGLGLGLGGCGLGIGGCGLGLGLGGCGLVNITAHPTPFPAQNLSSRPGGAPPVRLGVRNILLVYRRVQVVRKK